MAEDFAAELNESSRSVIVGVASKSMERARQFSSTFDIPQFFDSYEDLVESTDSDVIYIATTNDQHYQEAIMCARLGKALLVEKTFTATVAPVSSGASLSTWAEGGTSPWSGVAVGVVGEGAAQAARTSRVNPSNDQRRISIPLSLKKT